MDEGQTQMTWEELCNEMAKQIERAETAEDRCDALAALARELRTALGLATEALGHDKWLSSAYETALWRAHIPPGMEARADKALAGMELGDSGECNYSAEEVSELERAAWMACYRWMNEGERNAHAEQMQELAEGEALHRYPEKPQEGKEESRE